MTELTEHIDLTVPVETAYAAWSNFELFPNYLSFVEEVTPGADGKHHHWRVKIAGAEREFDTELVEQIENERIAWKSVGGDEDQSGVVTFHRLADDASRVTVQLGWKPEGLVETAGAALGIDNHAVKSDLENFKKRIEGSASEARGSDSDVRGSDPDLAV
ncbi:SRPBCC family protein [Leifsonia sp. NPDC058292]|uniref:SRPBCC family protein n=1 Tax=Leifsonia sp. NPDC058292 TaxID=3346428 RepID=UPI0036D8AA33